LKRPAQTLPHERHGAASAAETDRCGVKKDNGRDWAAIAGAVNGAAGLTLDGHIVCASAGGCYEIAGGNFRQAH